MKQIKVIHCFGRLNVGGAETLIMNIFNKMDHNQVHFDFLVFNSNPGFYDQEIKNKGCQIYYIPPIKISGLYKYIKNLIDFFNTHKVDVVHSHIDWQGGFIAYAAHKAGVKKIIIHSHANQKMFDNNILRHLLIKLNKWLIKKYATNCLACSKQAGESLFDKDYDVLINGIDIHKYISPNNERVQQIKESFHILDEDIVLGTIGGLSDNKNHSFLIQLLYELRKINQNYRLIIVGDGKMREPLEKQAMQLGLKDNILFTGIMLNVPEILCNFNIFLFPSKLEGLGIAAIEAQASGLPCIVSDSVPKQVDMNLDLVRFVDLDIEKWKNEILKLEIKDIHIDYSRLMESQYNIENACKQLYKIYASEEV